MAVETGRVAKGVQERVELFVGGSMVEELEVDGRVASVEAGRVASRSSGTICRWLGGRRTRSR